MDYTQVKGNDGLTDDERRRRKYGLDTEEVSTVPVVEEPDDDKQVAPVVSIFPVVP